MLGHGIAHQNRVSGSGPRLIAGGAMGYDIHSVVTLPVSKEEQCKIYEGMEQCV